MTSHKFIAGGGQRIEPDEQDSRRNDHPGPRGLRPRSRNYPPPPPPLRRPLHNPNPLIPMPFALRHCGEGRNLGRSAAGFQSGSSITVDTTVRSLPQSRTFLDCGEGRNDGAALRHTHAVPAPGSPFILRVPSGRTENNVFRHCGLRRNLGRSAAGFHSGSSITAGITVGDLPQSQTFLDCGLRRNDGAALRHTHALPVPGSPFILRVPSSPFILRVPSSPFILRVPGSPFVLRGLEGRTENNAFRHCGEGRNLGRSAAGFQSGSNITVGIAVGNLPQSRTFLDCGLRRNDGAALCHTQAVPAPGSPFILRVPSGRTENNALRHARAVPVHDCTFILRVPSGRTECNAFRHCGVGRNPGRSAAEFQSGSNITVDTTVRSLPQSQTFLDCGLRRNDGAALRHTHAVPVPGSPFIPRVPGSPFVLRGLEGRTGSNAFRHCGEGRNPGRSAAGFQSGSSITVDTTVRSLPQSRTFLDCGLRRNDGAALRHTQAVPVPGSPFIPRVPGSPFALRGLEGRTGSNAFRHCGEGRNPGRSAAGFQTGSNITVGIPVGTLPQSQTFLDCGLRRNDGAALCHTQAVPVPGSPFILRVPSGRTECNAFRHCGEGRNPGRSVAGFQSGSNITASIKVGNLPQSQTFLDCGLRRNDGAAIRHTHALPVPGSPFILRFPGSPFVLRGLEGRTSSRSYALEHCPSQYSVMSCSEGWAEAPIEEETVAGSR